MSLWYKSDMSKRILFLAFLLLPTSAVFSQQQFPTWMNEVQFERKNSNMSFSEPTAPVDPATGQSANNTSKVGRGFKPKLPDFSKMREKAIKAEFEKRAAAEGELENSYSASIKNLGALKQDKSRLETLLAANPGENERHQLQAAIGELTRKLALSEEFIELLNKKEPGTTGSQTASLTPAQFGRAIELQQLLFPGSRKKNAGSPPAQPARPAANASKTAQPTEFDYDREPTDEELAKAREYRPGKIKSFYHELKKSSQQNQESYSE